MPAPDEAQFDLGLLIKKLRKEAGLSQAQLAQRHGMSRATISGIENNTIAEVGIRKVAAILEGLGYELTAIPERRRMTLDELKSASVHDHGR
ncbi:helix-turn-helix domain-containing protein [Pseudomonas sp. PAGU 2196]|uniref:helix-turn-helix domain-containing protein n=1 Tax=Pseudomonas sp. PAGU 2196 TaxID=2793997 RepID=UPI001EE0A9E9|nr:helix-turn-helix transcriptional regulator [Pseudomonas sp. PAGU 2196]